MSVFIPPRELRALAAAGAAMLIGTLILQQFPALELSLFAAGAARLTGFLTGMPVGRIAEGWLLTSSSSVIAVTAACSAKDYYLMVVALLTWQRVRQGQTVFAALLVGLFAALPLTLFINALRIVGVTAARNLRCLFAPVFWGRRFFTRIDRTQSSPRNVWTHPRSQINRLS